MKWFGEKEKIIPPGSNIPHSAIVPPPDHMLVEIMSNDEVRALGFPSPDQESQHRNPTQKIMIRVPNGFGWTSGPFLVNYWDIESLEFAGTITKYVHKCHLQWRVS